MEITPDPCPLEAAARTLVPARASTGIRKLVADLIDLHGRHNLGRALGILQHDPRRYRDTIELRHAVRGAIKVIADERAEDLAQRTAQALDADRDDEWLPPTVHRRCVAQALAALEPAGGGHRAP